MSILPGAGYLGFGFNVYQDINMSGRTHPLFDMDETNGEYSLGDRTYDLPVNVVANPPDEPAIFEERLYESSDEFVRDLKTSADIAATIGGFEGKASAKYERLCHGMKNAVLCTISDTRPAYYLDLKATDPEHLNHEFRSDLDALPSAYNDATKLRFFRFIRKYGMHFVKSVTMGGHLNYFYSCEKQENETTEAISAKARASYGAVKGGGSGSWSAVDKQTFQSSRITIETAPAGTLNSVSPQFGEDLGDAYAAWARAAKEEPAVVSFQLAPISDLIFGEEKHSALAHAVEDFSECYIFAEATTSMEWRYPGRISVKGEPLTPEKDLPANYAWAARQVVVDRHTFRIRLNRVYGYRDVIVSEISGDMLADVLPYNNPDHILILTTGWGPNLKYSICVCRDMVGVRTYPTPSQRQYFDLLRAAGAGGELHSFLFNNYGHIVNTNDPNFQYTAYVFVGVLGRGPAREVFGHVPAGVSPPRNPKVSVSLEPSEKNGQPYYGLIL